MACVGIDVAKDKYDCFIMSSEGEVLAEVFTIQNSREGFEALLRQICSCTSPSDKIKVGLEATGHYSYNILGFLLFPEFEKLVPSLRLASVYALLSEFPGARQIAQAHLTRLKTVLNENSKGHYDREKVVEIRDAARQSIGSVMPAKSLFGGLTFNS